MEPNPNIISLFSNLLTSIFVCFQLGVGLFGLIGNIVSILIFSRKDMKTHFNRLLVGLAVFDCIFISLMIIDYSFIRGIYLSLDLPLSLMK